VAVGVAVIVMLALLGPVVAVLVALEMLTEVLEA
jgi:hypothetical protein